MEQSKRPRRAVGAGVIGILGGLWNLASMLFAGGFIVAGALARFGSLIYLGILSLFIPPLILVSSIVGSVLILAKRSKTGALVNIVASLIVLSELLLFLPIVHTPNLSAILVILFF